MKTSHTSSEKFIVTALIIIVLGLVLWLTNTFRTLTPQDELLLDSTVGELALWMSEQTTEDEIESYLGNLAEGWANNRGEETLAPEILLEDMRDGLTVYTAAIALFSIAGLIAVFTQADWVRSLLLFALIGLDGLLFIVPTIAGANILPLILSAIFVLLMALVFAEGEITKVLGFFIALSALFIVWEGAKLGAEQVNYKITMPQAAWTYDTFDTIETALDALDNRAVDAVILDRNDVRDLLAEYPIDPDDTPPDAMPYPNLRYLDDITTSETIAWFVIEPDFTGRLRVIVHADDVERFASIAALHTVSLATVTDEFADTNYLGEPRQLVLSDLKILNDINLPHLQNIAEALMQPARRNGPQLLVRILAGAALYTLGEAVFGFAFGALLGLLLGTLFAHSTLLERSLLPYVVASQTVPILAIAPMVVIWLGASQLSVAIIAAYLTFFPVTINTLRGLLSADASELELLKTYAATDSTIFWKLRFPAALPYIFTALKVSATASVVGAIIGELPSGIPDGLGRAILNFSSDYSLTSTPKLWASIVMAALVGILFFLVVAIAERLILGRYIRNL